MASEKKGKSGRGRSSGQPTAKGRSGGGQAEAYPITCGVCVYDDGPIEIGVVTYSDEGTRFDHIQGLEKMADIAVALRSEAPGAALVAVAKEGTKAKRAAAEISRQGFPVKLASLGKAREILPSGIEASDPILLGILAWCLLLQAKGVGAEDKERLLELAAERRRCLDAARDKAIQIQELLIARDQTAAMKLLVNAGGGQPEESMGILADLGGVFSDI